MIRDFKLLLLGSCCLAVTACAAPNREPDLSNIKSNVDQTRVSFRSILAIEGVHHRYTPCRNRGCGKKQGETESCG